MLHRHSEPAHSPSVPQTIEYRTKGSGAGFWLWLVIIMFAAVGLLAFNLRTHGRHPGTPPDQADKDRAILAAELAVRNNLGIGVVPRFAPKDWIKVERNGDRYLISSWLEAIPRNGGDGLSYDYSCSVYRNPAGDWAVSDINIQLQ